MDFELSTTQYIITFIGVFVAGLIDSIAGGGGLITIPLYISIGLPDHLILGTNKTVSSMGSLMAITRFIKNKAIVWREAGISIFFAVIGSFLGARISGVLSSHYMMYLLMLILPLIIILNKKLDFDRADIPRDLDLKTVVWRTTLIGLLIGFYDGFFGPGTGTFLFICLFLFLRLNPIEAGATGRVINFSANVSSFIYFAFSGRVAWELAAVAIVASVLGNYIGSGLVLTKARHVIKPVFNFVVVLLFGKCIYTLFGA